MKYYRKSLNILLIVSILIFFSSTVVLSQTTNIDTNVENTNANQLTGPTDQNISENILTDITTSNPAPSSGGDNDPSSSGVTNQEGQNASEMNSDDLNKQSADITEGADVQSNSNTNDQAEFNTQPVPDKGSFAKPTLRRNAQMTNALSNRSISNDYLETAVNNTDSSYYGRFTIGTTGGNPNNPNDNYKKLLYGHPDPWSSFTTFNIDGNNSIFNSSNTVTNSDSITTTETISNINVQQSLTLINNPYTGLKDTVQIKYTVKNNDNQSHNIGTRIMLDTMLGNNDGAPFRIPGIGNVTTEREFTGDQIPEYWQAFDSLENPNVISFGTLYRNASERPDKVQFAYWSGIYGSIWNYTVSPYTAVTSDSAVAMYWNPNELKPGQTHQFVTYYGIGDFAIQDLRPPLAIRIEAPQELITNETNNGYSPNPFTVTAYVWNNGTGTAKNSKLHLELPSGLSLVSGSQDVSLDDLEQSAEKNISWQVKADNQTTEKTLNYSIKASADNSEDKLMNLNVEIPAVQTNSTSHFNGHLVTKVTLNKPKLTLTVGGSKETLTATVSPSDAAYKAVNWRSDKEAVATVNVRTGEVTPRGVGTCHITASTIDGSGKYGQCTVTVNPATSNIIVNSPINGSIYPKIDIVLDWNAVQGTNYYELSIIDSTTGTSLIKNYKNLTTKYLVKSSQLTENHWYTFNIKAADLSGQETSTQVVIFITDRKTIYDKGDLRITWDSKPGTISYKVAMRDLTTNEKFIDNLVTKETNFRIDGSLLSEGHLYRIAIGYFDSNEMSNWAESIIEIAQPMQKPVIISPKDGGAFDQGDIIVKWNPVQRAINYQVKVLDRTTLTQTLDTNNSINTSYKIDKSLLLDGHVYEIVITATNSAGSQVWTGLEITIGKSN